MSTERAPFHVTLNLMHITPRDSDYWKGHLKRLQLDLESNQGVQADVSFGAFSFNQHFVLGARTDEAMKQYEEVKARVAQTIEQYIKPV